MVLTDRDSKVQTWTSGGTIGYKNANKATPMAAELAAKELAKRAIGLGFHSVVVKLKGMGKNKQFAVQSLAANGLTVSQLQDVTPIPYNGCRLPRRRRVQLQLNNSSSSTGRVFQAVAKATAQDFGRLKHRNMSTNCRATLGLSDHGTRLKRGCAAGMCTISPSISCSWKASSSRQRVRALSAHGSSSAGRSTGRHAAAQASAAASATVFCKNRRAASGSNAEDSYDADEAAAAPMHALPGSRIEPDETYEAYEQSEEPLYGGSFDATHYDSQNWEQMTSLLSFDGEEHKYLMRHMPGAGTRVEDMFASFDAGQARPAASVSEGMLGMAGVGAATVATQQRQPGEVWSYSSRVQSAAPVLLVPLAAATAAMAGAWGGAGQLGGVGGAAEAAAGGVEARTRLPALPSSDDEECERGMLAAKIVSGSSSSSKAGCGSWEPASGAGPVNDVVVEYNAMPLDGAVFARRANGTAALRRALCKLKGGVVASNRFGSRRSSSSS
ncbi:hypothetical protein OEZ86_003975 [Tetradesmus obliquus]|nr:hypothetical protein OEZ86_003975 [Tetradesmus obliquus]